MGIIDDTIRKLYDAHKHKQVLVEEKCVTSMGKCDDFRFDILHIRKFLVVSCNIMCSILFF